MSGTEMAPTPKQQLASVLLGENVDTYVTSRRADGKPWRLIARDIYEATQGQVDISHESLRGWYPDTDKGAAVIAHTQEARRQGRASATTAGL